MTSLISVERLINRLDNNQNNTVIIDVRFKLDEADAGRKQYLESHIPGAVYLDLNKDLSGRAEKHGGAHPLPDFPIFSRKLGNIGIDEETTIVIYDEGNDMYAARLWWLLEAIGHTKVYILEGGFTRWLEEGHATTAEVPALKPKEYKASFQEASIVDMETVKEKVAAGTKLIDSRAKDRYLGDFEPMYSKAGHIPGAKNYPWKKVLNDDGKWLKGEELKKHFSDLHPEEEIIVSCGSGVSATVNILALKAAGYKNVKLYPGSFSDWISYDENEIELGEERE
jgi:thiosulfate/3-mercaptopyruvate sulfurtransferase